MFGVQMVSTSYDIFFERSLPVRLNYIEAHIQLNCTTAAVLFF